MSTKKPQNEDAMTSMGVTIAQGIFFIFLAAFFVLLTLSVALARLEINFKEAGNSWGSILKKKSFFVVGILPLVTGVVNLAEDPKKFYPSKVSLLKDESDDRVTSVRVSVPLHHLNPHSLTQLKQIVLSYRGSVPVHFIFETSEGRARMQLDDTFMVSPSPQMAAKLNELLNTNSVSFIIDGKVEELRQ